MDARNYNDLPVSDDNISNGGNDLHVSETLDVEIKDVMRSSHFWFNFVWFLSNFKKINSKKVMKQLTE